MSTYTYGDRVHKENYPDFGTVVPSLDGVLGPAPMGIVYVRWDHTGSSCESISELFPADVLTPLQRLAAATGLARQHSPDFDPDALRQWAQQIVNTLISRTGHSAAHGA